MYAKFARVLGQRSSFEALWEIAVWTIPQGTTITQTVDCSLIHSQVLGLSIDEAIAFWRKSFSNKTDDKFNKEYKYNIRHSYGLEGKRANYPAKRYELTCLEPCG